MYKNERKEIILLKLMLIFKTTVSKSSGIKIIGSIKKQNIESINLKTQVEISIR